MLMGYVLGFATPVVIMLAAAVYLAIADDGEKQYRGRNTDMLERAPYRISELP